LGKQAASACGSVSSRTEFGKKLLKLLLDSRLTVDNDSVADNDSDSKRVRLIGKRSASTGNSHGVTEMAKSDNKAASEAGNVATVETPTVETTKPELTAEQVKWSEAVNRIRAVVPVWSSMALDARLAFWRALFGHLGDCPVDAGMSSTESGKRRPRLYSTPNTRKLCKVFAKLYSSIGTMSDIVTVLSEFAVHEHLDYRKVGVGGMAYAKADSRSESAYRSVPFVFLVPAKLSGAVAIQVAPAQLSEISLDDL
jgi:hypothetical protein